MTFDEVDAMVSAITESPDRTSVTERAEREIEWCESVAEWKSRPGFESPHKFVRLWNRPSAVLYVSAPGTSSKPKRLIVCYAGVWRRMMVPAWVFLALFPAEPCYVLMMRPERARHAEGLPGITKDFASTIEWIRNLAKSLGVPIDVAIGSSGGALSAVFAGAILGARRRIAFGLPSLKSNGEDGAIPFNREYARKMDSGEGLTLVIGTDNAMDVAAGQDASTMFPAAEMIYVPNAGHNVIGPLAKRGELHELFFRVFGTSRRSWFSSSR